MVSSLDAVPDYGRRLLPTVIDDAAVHDPDHIVYSFTKTDDPADGFYRVSNRRYADGVNRVAWLIRQGFGRPEPDTFPSIGYIGPNDLRYAMLTVAAVKVGYTMMYLSPRNSIEGHLAVLDKCACERWILPAQKLGHVQHILETRALTVLSLPEQVDLLGLGEAGETAVCLYPYTKTFAAARQEPFVVLHTSGSTGLPKPVRVPHGSLATIDAQHLLPPVDGQVTHAQFFGDAKTAYSTYPNFHASSPSSAGMAFCFALPFYYRLSIVLGPALMPVNLDLVNRMLAYAGVDGSLLAPSTLEQMSKDPASLARLAATQFTVVGGAPLNKACGDRINAVCRVINIMGVTEGSLFPVVLARDPADWHYHHFHPAGGYTFVPRTDELYEQVQTRQPGLDLFQAFLQTFPLENEVATKDMYSKHPTKEGLWLYRGRADDVLVLSNGEKVNPIDMEAALASHPDVKAVLIVGQGRFQVAAVIELLRPADIDADADAARFWESLWVFVDRANREAPAHGQLHRDFVILASPAKPFALAGKETVLRAVTTQLYQPEIDALYAEQAAKSLSGADLPKVDVTDKATIRSSLRALLARILNVSDKALGDTEDLFVAGLDSLSVLRVVARLKASLKEHATAAEGVSLGLIYANPTLEKLTTAADHLVRPVHQNDKGLDASDDDVMQGLLDACIKDLPVRPPPSSAGHAYVSVLLTGSTGSLGAYLLDTLLANPAVRRVVCLNRTANARERQTDDARARGLQQDLSAPRVEFLHADLSKPRLGLSTTAYASLVRETTHILHNQWPVNFHLQVSSFAPHLQGVRHLVDLAIAGQQHPTVVFVSSVGVVQARTTNDAVPETAVTHFADAEGGYGQSKLLAELILAHAAKTSGVTVHICRLGQIAGPVNTLQGSWNRQEWLPSIIASSHHLGKLPATLASLDRVDWLPVNRASEIIVELAGLRANRDDPVHPVYHVVNPQAVPWSTLAPTVAARLGLDSDKDVVPWADWLMALAASEPDGDYDANPGLKLLPFYRSVATAGTAGRAMPVLETAVSQKKSATLKAMKPVSPTWVDEWMTQWGF